MNIRFVSRNPYKIKEVQGILQHSSIVIIPVDLHIEEIQTTDVSKLVRDKTLKAFNQIGKPVFVEHTGLYIKNLNGFPGGLTQIFWDNLLADKFSDIIGNFNDPSVQAKTTIGYCDGRKIHFFEGSINGIISNSPIGSRDFQWDCVFIPDGYHKTFAELGAEKDSISMRKKALEQFQNYLKKN